MVTKTETEQSTNRSKETTPDRDKWRDAIMGVGRLGWARREARALLARCDVRSPRDIRIGTIARKLDIALEQCELDGADAELVRFGNQIRILVSDRLIDRAAIRFAIAHELGHFVLGHPSPTIRQLAARTWSRHHAYRSRQHESEANTFASELLMPEQFLGKTCEHAPVDLDVPRWIADQFSVSLLASAIRFTELSKARCAAVFASGGRVRWAAESAAFPQRLERGRLLHAASPAARFFVDGSLDKYPRQLEAHVWLDAPANGEIIEHATCSDQHRTVLSMLWFRASTSAIASSPPVEIRRI